MRVHFIAVGGAAMHNLAIALKKKGYEVSGSDDEIFEPARSRLQQYHILPDRTGWQPQLITSSLDAVILGMHAKADNPELRKAKELGVKIYSYPEYLYEQSKNKIRIVVGGSHGKTTITSIILHVLHQCAIECDYMVGAQLDGFEVMVKLSDETPYMIIEGDEYLTSALDPRPKFHVYQPHIALISGIAWDHVNVFPVFEQYVRQFEIFAGLLPDDGVLIYCAEDENCRQIAQKRHLQKSFGYHLPEYSVKNGIFFVHVGNRKIPLPFFGKHNLLNMQAARLACRELGVSDEQFYAAVQTFAGAKKRLELVGKNTTTSFYKDFAHSPSKLKATIEAVKDKYPHRKLIACFELHTFSSFSISFLREYAQILPTVDKALLYYNPHTLRLKKLPIDTETNIRRIFAQTTVEVYSDTETLCNALLQKKWDNANLLMMSSGNFDGMDYLRIADKIIPEK
jgi:UDP-N-acetylmuramate: L-alanyl-gamma-D-glutamyl-meso-diaminopimelate ligase